VRYRGVMEKCTYCIQRINLARIDAKREDRAIGDGEVVTACAQACPTQAIFFGNLNDSAAAVTKLKSEPTNYGLLDELQTQPRTTYLPRFTNPHDADGAKEPNPARAEECHPERTRDGSACPNPDASERLSMTRPAGETS